LYYAFYSRSGGGCQETKREIENHCSVICRQVSPLVFFKSVYIYGGGLFIGGRLRILFGLIEFRRWRQTEKCGARRVREEIGFGRRWENGRSLAAEENCKLA